jgi:hypothetical protein
MICPCSGDCDRSAHEAYRDDTLGGLLRRDDRDDDRRNRSLALPGVEVIDIEVREPTAQLTLNAVNTTFVSVTADDGAERAAVALDAAAWIRERK